MADEAPPVTDDPQAIVDLDPTPALLGPREAVGGADWSLLAGKAAAGVGLMGATLLGVFGLVGKGMSIGYGGLVAGLGAIGIAGAARMYRENHRPEVMPNLAERLSPGALWELEEDVQVAALRVERASQGEQFELKVFFQNCSDQRRTVRLRVESDAPNAALAMHAGRHDGLTFTPSARAHVGPAQIAMLTLPISVGVEAKSTELRLYFGATGNPGKRVRYFRARQLVAGVGLKACIEVAAAPGAEVPPRAAPRWELVWTPGAELMLAAAGRARFL